MNEHNDVNVSLDLNEKWRIFLRNELSTFALEHPDDKFRINCWLDDNAIISVHEIDNYLAQNDCKSRLKTGAQIIGKGRSTSSTPTRKLGLSTRA